MAFLSSEAAAALVGSTVRMATLVELQFTSATSRLWNGTGRISVASQIWEGIGALGSIDGLEQGRQAQSSKVTMRLSGVSSEVLASALASKTEVQGGLAYVWLQLFDGDWQPVGARIPVFWGIMQRLGITREAASQLSGGARICELEVENGFYGRARPPAGRYTDTDQQSRYPGDKFCRFVPVQRSQIIVWPDY
jgi:hypothetical protein